MNLRLPLGGACIAMCLATAAAAQAPACADERYYAPHDYRRDAPLSRPHAEFARALRLAETGDASQQRSLAIAYEVGYMVDGCAARARYWYGKAAAAGDVEAKRWLAREQIAETFRASRECAAASCPSYTAGPQLVDLYAAPNGNYYASVTINGTSTPVVVDTGATLVSMSATTAKTIGLAWENGRVVTMRTANGNKQARLVTLASVQFGNIVLHDVAGAVSEGDMPTLLGMSFLGQLNVSLRQGSMSISRPDGGSTVTVEQQPTPREQPEED